MNIESSKECRLARPLRVAVVTETFPPEINGVARTVEAMVGWLLARGHAVDLVRPRQEFEALRERHEALAEMLTAGAPVPGYPQIRLGICSAGRLANAWRRSKPDLVHVVTEGPLGWAAVKAASSLAIPVTTDFHTNFHTYSAHYGFAWLQRPLSAYLRVLHNRTACTIVPTPQLKRDLERLQFERVIVAPRGVDVTLFSPVKRSEGLRREWGCRNGELLVLYVGRLAAEKNLELFASAAMGMQAVNPSVRVVVVGDGPRKKALLRRCPGFIFAGVRTGEDLAAHYASADVLLFPSSTETFGNVTLEAMASGLAVLAFDEAAARQHVVHLESGLLANPGDASHFRHLAGLLAHEPDLRLALGREAVRAAQDLTWDAAYRQLEPLLLEVSTRRPLFGNVLSLSLSGNSRESIEPCIESRK